MKRSFTENTWRTDPMFRALCRAIATCKTAEGVADFLRDVGTLSELKAWSERFAVAGMLAEGRTYRQASKMTGASTTTVTRVASFLIGGAGGYVRALKNTHHHHAHALREKRMASVID